MILEVSNASAVTLKVDPTVIFASKKYVDDKVASISQNTTQIIDKIGDINNIEVEDVKNIVEGVNKVNSKFNTHTKEMAKHNQFIEGNKKYQVILGWNTTLNCPTMDYVEVVE